MSFAAIRIARWLGPWSPESARPGGAVRRTEWVDDGRGGSVKVWIFAPRRPARGAWLLLPGVHYDGPTDLRVDRLARVLADAGGVVAVPFLRDYMRLEVRPRVVDDALAGAEALWRAPERPPSCGLSIFSISFGSLPAFKVAGHPRWRERIDAVITFGGYVDWDSTVRFCLTGEVDGEQLFDHDPLNRPVVFLTLRDQFGVGPAETERLAHAWRRYCRRTWGRPHMKRDQRWVDEAKVVARGLDAGLRELFLQGCDAAPGGLERALEALDRTEQGPYDPRPALAEVRAAIHAIHGLDDDVIPARELDQLAAAAPNARSVRTYLTGLYGHTGTGETAAGQLAEELRTMAAMVATLGRFGRVG